MNLLDIAVLEARRKFYLKIGATHLDGMAMDEASHVITEAVIDLVNQLPAHDAVSPLLASVGLEAVYRYALEERKQIETLQAVVEELTHKFPPSSTPRLLGCPRGCNFLYTCAGYDECEACGAIMTPDEDEYQFEEDDFEMIKVAECYPVIFKDLGLDGPKLGTWYVGFTVKSESGISIHEVCAVGQYVGGGKFRNQHADIDLGPVMLSADYIVEQV